MQNILQKIYITFGIVTLILASGCHISGSTTQSLPVNVSFAESSITIGSKTIATVMLLESASISSPIHIIVTSSNPSIIKVMPNDCNLNNSLKSCSITLKGVGVGSSTISLSAAGYNPIDSNRLTITTGFAYITNNIGNSITQCVVDNDGIEDSTCKVMIPTGSGMLDAPEGIAIHKNFIYVANSNNNSYTQCEVNASGLNLTSCKTTIPSSTALFDYPQGVTINGEMIYFIQRGISNGNSGYTQCVLGSDGIDNSTCRTFSNTALNSNTHVMAAKDNNAYFFGRNTSFGKCAISKNGIENTTCQSVNSSIGFNDPDGVAIDDDRIYIIGDESYTQCNIDSSEIKLSTCINYKPTGSGAILDGEGVAINNSFAYIINSFSQNAYTKCALDSAGIIENTCKTIKPNDADGVDVLSGPSYIAFY